MAVEVEQRGELKPEHWQKNVLSLAEGIAKLFETKEFSDVQLVVGDRTFKAHRLILAARSPEFLKVLLKKELTSKVIVDGVSEDGLEILLRYIYTDEVGELDRSKLLEAHRAASQYQQKGLLKLCEDRIACWEITCENVCSLLNHLSDIQSMRERCLLFLKNNALSVLTTDSLTEATHATFWLMFESGFFKHAPAMTRLKNALRWATDQLPEQTDFSMVRDLLLKGKPILGRCGIERLTSAELTTIIAQYKNLLTPEESMSFFMNANSKGSIPLPSWCQPDS